jgi:CRISPR/Cas system Type II protein with McrA/HNH and RuvC-like nuclease domain
MDILHSPQEYLFNLYTTSPGEARRIWKKKIKEKWENKCAYCGSEENLTIDHVIPQSRGGNDFISNVICSCENCNKSKSHQDWEDWFSKQEFFTSDRKNAIIEWTQFSQKKKLYTYKPRRNNAT